MSQTAPACEISPHKKHWKILWQSHPQSVTSSSQFDKKTPSQNPHFAYPSNNKQAPHFPQFVALSLPQAKNGDRQFWK